MAECKTCGGKGYLSHRDGYGRHVDGCTDCGGKGYEYVSAYRDYDGRGPERANIKRGSGKSCFPKGTLVLSPSGNKDISDIKKGDIVFSYNTKNQQLIHSRVISTKKHYNENISIILLNDGTKIKTTLSHSFLSSKGKWKKASSLKKNDVVKTIDGNKKVESIKITNKIESVYNIIVDDNYNFIAGNNIAHSFSYFRRIRVLYFSVKKIIISCLKISSTYDWVSKHHSYLKQSEIILNKENLRNLQ